MSVIVYNWINNYALIVNFYNKLESYEKAIIRGVF